MTIGFSVPIPYAPVESHGYLMNLMVGKFIVFNQATGFEDGTQACTEQEALAKRKNPRVDDQVAELKFLPQE